MLVLLSAGAIAAAVDDERVALHVDNGDCSGSNVAATPPKHEQLRHGLDGAFNEESAACKAQPPDPLDDVDGGRLISCAPSRAGS